MIIAIPVNSDRKSICPSFGRTPEFLFIDSDNGEKKYIANPAADAEGGAGIKASEFIIDNNTDVLITPRCGKNAADILLPAEIKILKSSSDDLDKVLCDYYNNELTLLSSFTSGFGKN